MLLGPLLCLLLPSLRLLLLLLRLLLLLLPGCLVWPPSSSLCRVQLHMTCSVVAAPAHASRLRAKGWLHCCWRDMLQRR
jgi:hypothetical protein